MRIAVRLAAALAVLLLSPISWAEDPIGRISLGGSGGFSTYLLSDVDDRVSTGNRWLDEQGWKTIDPLGSGWTFWADFKIPVPMIDFLFITGGYGSSSGSTGGLDYNELTTVEVTQEAYHARVLYVIPFRFHEDVRLFFGGGPLFIQNQEVRATHTRRTSAGGGSGTETRERTEEVIYSGNGAGWQIGLAAEYLLQDHLTLSLDFAYRWATIDYSDWSASKNVIISDTDPAEWGDGTTGLERLDRENSYVLRGFLDYEATQEREGEVEHEYGPHLLQLVPVSPQDLDINLSGLQIHIGLRFYFL